MHYPCVRKDNDRELLPAAPATTQYINHDLHQIHIRDIQARCQQVADEICRQSPFVGGKQKTCGKKRRLYEETDILFIVSHNAPSL